MGPFLCSLDNLFNLSLKILAKTGSKAKCKNKNKLLVSRKKKKNVLRVVRLNRGGNGIEIESF